MFKSVIFPDDQLKYSSPIDGLDFCANVLQANVLVPSMTNVLSNTGDVVGHFVTHSHNFAYTNFGIHVGQVDRLTFYAQRQRSIEGYFIDCRRESPTSGVHLHIKFSSGVKRKLIIPCGVAHTFSNLEEVVTRNDLSLYAGKANATWNVLNDNIVFDWTPDGIRSAPRVDVNLVPIPLEVNRIFYRLQQSALKAIRMDTLKRDFADTENANVRLLHAPHWETGIAGCEWGTNCFDEIATGSWMILPGTPSCEMTMALFQLDGARTHCYIQRLDRDVLLTFLDREGQLVELDLIDLRLDNVTYGCHSPTRWVCDPRFFLRIPAGVAYRPVGSGVFAIREEFDLPTTDSYRITALTDIELRSEMPRQL
jgi:dTDP-4-dehydrorhamnose 3,5-epimerase-like enzyme